MYFKLHIVSRWISIRLYNVKCYNVKFYVIAIYTFTLNTLFFKIVTFTTYNYISFQENVTVFEKNQLVMSYIVKTMQRKYDVKLKINIGNVWSYIFIF